MNSRRRSLGIEHEEYNEEMAGEKDGEVVTFEFPIKYSGRVAPTKSISPHVLPNFHSLENEDPDVFLFQFELLCRGYGYCDEDQNLNVFPLTLEGETL